MGMAGEEIEFYDLKKIRNEAQEKINVYKHHIYPISQGFIPKAEREKATLNLVKEHFPDLAAHYEEHQRETRAMNQHFNTDTDRDYSDDENEEKVDNRKNYGSNIYVENEQDSRGGQIKGFKSHQITEEDLSDPRFIEGDFHSNEVIKKSERQMDYSGGEI